MTQHTFDVIVIGVGGMGSAAACELARRGRRVLALEQFALGHDRGSSHGHTRIIRKAYHEHPDYVPLVCRAFERWYDLEQRQGIHLLTACPCLSIGPVESEMIAGVRASAEQHHLPVEPLSAADLRRRFPAFRFDDNHVGVLERSAGFLYVEDCVQAHACEAVRLGATIHDNEPVVSWQANEREAIVQTTAERYTAARLVLTAGPWAGQLLASHGAFLRVMRQVVQWFGTRDDSLFRRDVFPLYIADTPQGHFYGFPVLNANGAKMARHYGAPELTAPSEIERSIKPEDEETARAFLREHLPMIDGPCRRASVCIYTLTPDRHFVIDLHPDHPNVALAAGFSGHGFKFASVVGEILADLSDNGGTELPIGMFRIKRFAT
ncbi:MAG TPA: N-methyl-L-tryptophan oxidase [Gemmataceae bacterium]|nr:N-methyl-L-tryptophan oxidase [Gemmataceae bacterium]